MSVDWNQVSTTTFPYRLRQKPGPQNPLGGVKFKFPNQFNVYLHDTPQREHFSNSVRTFSSGCIRLERADELAFDLLDGQDGWTLDDIHRAMNSGQEQTVYLQTPCPVHLEYWTAWVEATGAIQFREDIYERDVWLLNALRERKPVSQRRVGLFGDRDSSRILAGGVNEQENRSEDQAARRPPTGCGSGSRDVRCRQAAHPHLREPGSGCSRQRLGTPATHPRSR
jgi:hypothetical protein